MIRWEYKFGFILNNTNGDLEKAMNVLGQEGWELVDIRYSTTEIHKYYCTLKRPTPDSTPIPIPATDRI